MFSRRQSYAVINSVTFCMLFCLLALTSVQAQQISFRKAGLTASQVYMSQTQGGAIVRVVKDSTVKEADEPTFARVETVLFHNGIIEVEVLSKLLPNARPSDRGFIGVAFRIQEDNSQFECLYLRPTNGRAEDQVRRNHAVQYFAYPAYKFDRLRKESPEKYESYADMGLGEWIPVKIVVKDSQAKLFLHSQDQPVLVVNDLKHGPDAKGKIGLFVDVGTEGYFRKLRVTTKD